MCVVSEISKHLSAFYTELLILLLIKKTQAKYVNSSTQLSIYCTYTVGIP